MDSYYCKDSLCHSHPLSSSSSVLLIFCPPSCPPSCLPSLSSVLLPTLPVGELVHVRVRRCVVVGREWETVLPFLSHPLSSILPSTSTCLFHPSNPQCFTLRVLLFLSSSPPFPSCPSYCPPSPPPLHFLPPSCLIPSPPSYPSYPSPCLRTGVVRIDGRVGGEERQCHHEPIRDRGQRPQQ